MQSIVEPENEDEFAEEPLSQNGENLLTRRNRRTLLQLHCLTLCFYINRQNSYLYCQRSWFSCSSSCNIALFHDYDGRKNLRGASCTPVRSNRSYCPLCCHRVGCNAIQKYVF